MLRLQRVDRRSSGASKYERVWSSVISRKAAIAGVRSMNISRSGLSVVEEVIRGIRSRVATTK